jgi:ferredoxin
VVTAAGRVHVTLDQDRCCASGQCVLAVPEVFDQRDEDGVAVILVPDPPAALHAKLRAAAVRCPAQCIQVTDASRSPTVPIGQP